MGESIQMGIAGIAFICGGPLLSLIMFGLAFLYARKANAVKRWDRTIGTILSSSLKSSSSSESGTSYAPRVVYQYEVNGQAYQSDSMNVTDMMGGWNGTSEGEAKAKAARFPVGAQIHVRYDPTKPQNAVLDASTPNFMIWFLYAMGLFMACGGIGGGLIFLLRSSLIPLP
jgi:hypothetical protein